MSLQKNFERIEVFFLRFSQLALIIMMLLTSLDALGRYFFSNSITGAYEVTEYYLMIILVFASLSYVQKVDGHIRLDVLFSKFSEKVQNYLNVFFYIVGGFYFFIIGYEALLSTMQAFENNLIMSGIINFPLWLSYIWIPLGSFLIVIRFLLNSIRLLFFTSKKNSNYSEVND